jgi:hypothetical protein
MPARLHQLHPAGKPQRQIRSFFDAYGYEINDLATTFAAKVQARYRPATPDEAPHALDDFDAIVRANDLPFDYEKSDLYDEAVILARVMLEPTEGVMPCWVPRTGKLHL